MLQITQLEEHWKLSSKDTVFRFCAGPIFTDLEKYFSCNLFTKKFDCIKINKTRMSNVLLRRINNFLNSSSISTNYKQENASNFIILQIPPLFKTYYQFLCIYELQKNC